MLLSDSDSYTVERKSCIVTPHLITKPRDEERTLKPPILYKEIRFRQLNSTVIDLAAANLYATF
jgi:hypothetical protein